MDINTNATTAPGTLTSPTERTDAPVTDNGSIGKEAFLELLVTQLQNQDPLSPMEGTEFVDQLATFTNVEQSLRQSDALDVIGLQLTGLAANEAIGLIGKEVTVRGEQMAFDGVNATGFNANLPSSAESVVVTIRDANGEAIRTMDLGPRPGGTLSLEWDGRDNNGQLAASGTYAVEIAATDARGNPIEVAQEVTGRVVGVSFDKGFPEVILASGATAPISDLVGVNQGASPTPPSPTGSPAPPPSSAETPPGAPVGAAAQTTADDPSSPVEPISALFGR